MSNKEVVIGISNGKILKVDKETFASDKRTVHNDLQKGKSKEKEGICVNCGHNIFLNPKYNENWIHKHYFLKGKERVYHNSHCGCRNPIPKFKNEEVFASVKEEFSFLQRIDKNIEVIEKSRLRKGTKDITVKYLEVLRSVFLLCLKELEKKKSGICFDCNIPIYPNDADVGENLKFRSHIKHNRILFYYEDDVAEVLGRMKK